MSEQFWLGFGVGGVIAMISAFVFLWYAFDDLD